MRGLPRSKIGAEISEFEDRARLLVARASYIIPRMIFCAKTTYTAHRIGLSMSDAGSAKKARGYVTVQVQPLPAQLLAPETPCEYATQRLLTLSSELH